jgi:photosystem II stability/assembly factor-like uncharacterized protein
MKKRLRFFPIYIKKMKHKVFSKVLILFMLIISSFCLSKAQDNSWQQMNGPYGGFISQMITGNNGCVCAATDFGGLYVSNDYGKHWTERVGDWIECLAVNKKGKLFAGGIRSIFTSTDDGLTWTSVSPPEFSGMWISAIAIDSSNRVYAGGYNGLFRSDNDGESWIPINSGLENLSAQYPFCLAAGPEGVVFAGFLEGIYRTTDHGTHWSQINDGIPSDSREMRSIVITKSGYVLAATYVKGVFRSTIYGNSWVEVLDDYSFSLTIDKSGHIFQGSMGNGIYKSDDEGLTWLPVNTGLGDLEVRSLAANSEDTIFAGTHGMGVFRSSNLGLSWEEMNDGLDNIWIDFLTGNSKNEIFAGCSGGGVLKTSDGGVTWTRVAQGLDPMIYSLTIDSADRIFVSNRDGAFMSTDNGKSWETLFSNFPYYMNFAFSSTGNIVATGFLLTGGGVWISDNRGTNWIQSLVIDPPDSPTDVLINDNNDIFVGSYINGLYISKDFGASWDKKMIDPLYYNVFKLFLNKNGSLFASAFDSDWGCKVFRSEDNGATWTNVSDSLPNNQVFSFAAKSDSCIFLGTMGSGVYCSSDNGQTWIPTNNGLKRKNISSLYIDRNGYLYAGSTGGDNRKKSLGKGYKKGVYLNGDQFNKGNMIDAIKGGYLFRIHADAAVVTGIDDTKPESNYGNLEQNYPNPFSGETEIRFTLPEAMHIQLRLFNSIGVLVKTLLDVEASAGLNTVRLNADNLKSGIYFYQLNTGTHTQVKNMIIIK